MGRRAGRFGDSREISDFNMAAKRRKRRRLELPKTPQKPKKQKQEEYGSQPPEDSRTLHRCGVAQVLDLPQRPV